MARRIAIIQGHPDTQARHFCHALADEYVKGSQDGRHEVKRIGVATLDFPILRKKEDFEKESPPDAIKQAQDEINWAGTISLSSIRSGSAACPLCSKHFSNKSFVPALPSILANLTRMPKKCLTGKSARIIVTMGMPAFVY